MDHVWDELGCDQYIYDSNILERYYRHPVWILNSIFIENHPASVQNRKDIVDSILKLSPKRILDFGGGGGLLARMIASQMPDIQIDIFEPYPSDFAISKCNIYPNIRFLNDLDGSLYDLVISTDVLEHVTTPLRLLNLMTTNTSDMGHLIIQNSFYPVIKCHLVSNNHFRFTFDVFAYFLGLNRVPNLSNNFVPLYLKVSRHIFPWSIIYIFELISRLIFWPLRVLQKILRILRLFPTSR